MPLVHACMEATSTAARNSKFFLQNSKFFWSKALSHYLAGGLFLPRCTSIYGEALAEFLYNAGCHIAIVVNPVRMRSGERLRTKTPKANAAPIARFCEAVRPVAWVPSHCLGQYAIQLATDISF